MASILGLAIRESPSLPPEIEELRVLGGKHICEDDPESAEKLLRKALVMAEESLGLESEALIPLLEQIAGLLGTLDRHGESRTFFNRAIDLSLWSHLDPSAAAN